MASTPIQDDERDEQPGGTSDANDAPDVSDASDEHASPAAGEKVASWREEMLEEIDTIAQQEGKVLFDGEWLHPDEVKRYHWRLRFGSLRVIVEVVVLCVALAALAWILWLILFIMGGLDFTPVG